MESLAESMPGQAAMPRFEDGSINLRELMRRQAEDVVNAIMDAEAEPDALAYLAFPPSHWKRLRTNNLQERANREIKRCSRVVQVFPSEKSLERLVGGRDVRARRAMVRVALLRIRQDPGALRQAARGRSRVRKARSRARRSRQEDDRREPRACGKGGGGVAWPIRFRDSGEGPNPWPSRIAVRSGCLR